MISQLKTIVTRLLAEDVMQQVMKGTITYLAKSIKNLQGELLQDIASYTIAAIKSHSNSFDEADYILRDELFNYYCSCEQYKEAAQVLCGLNLESTGKNYTPQEKADIYVKCAEACLEDDETVDAEVFVNKASIYMNDVSDISLLLRYRVTFARVLDSNRKFVEAAMKYYELSSTTNADVNQDDLIELLCKAVTCAVLGKAGPQRTRVLGLLYKDERIRNLEQIPKYSSHASILTKMYTQQLLRADELNSFEATLAPHQIALTSDGFTVPEKAVIEHNMLAAGKI
jgi:COP9 signalosome complex subunit 4